MTKHSKSTSYTPTEFATELQKVSELYTNHLHEKLNEATSALTLAGQYVHKAQEEVGNISQVRSDLDTYQGHLRDIERLSRTHDFVNPNGKNLTSLVESLDQVTRDSKTAPDGVPYVADIGQKVTQAKNTLTSLFPDGIYERTGETLTQLAASAQQIIAEAEERIAQVGVKGEWLAGVYTQITSMENNLKRLQETYHSLLEGNDLPPTETGEPSSTNKTPAAHEDNSPFRRAMKRFSNTGGSA